MATSLIHIPDKFYKDFKTERVIDGHTIYLPDPPNKNKILNYNKPTTKQRYVKEEFPTEYQFSSFPASKQNEYFESWCNSRYYGQWFLNNGNIEYITGDNWVYLNCIDIGSNNFLNFIDSDRDFWYVWEMVKNNEFIRGLLFGTYRGNGKTLKGIAIALNHATSTYRGYVGMQSKVETDMEIIFERMVVVWQNLPFFMRPVFSNSTAPKDAIKFFAPSSMTKSKEVQQIPALRTRIDYASSEEGAYDSKRLTFKFDDEIGKTKDVDVDRRFDITKECLKENGRWRGKYYGTSTVEDETDREGNSLGVDSWSIKNFKKLWDKSKYNTINANGMTDSSCITLFNPACRGFGVFVDDYGYSIEDKAIEYHQNERRGKDGDKLLSLIRKYPLSEEEFFSAVEMDTDFNPQLLNDQMNWNNKYLQPPDPIIVNSSFRLEWRGGIFGGDVEAVPDKNGAFNIIWHPPFPNRRNFHQGQWRPANTNSGNIGTDPVAKLKGDTTRSKYAAVGLRWEEDNPDVLPIYDNAAVFRYNARFDDPTQHHEDMLKAAIYYGWEVMFENNIDAGIQYFIEKNFVKYCALTPKEFNGKKPVTPTCIGIGTRSDPNRNLLMQNLMRYVTSHCGWNEETGKQGTLYYNEILQDIKNLFEDKTGKWTKRDETVAFMMALANKYSIKKKNRVDVSGLGLNDFYKK